MTPAAPASRLSCRAYRGRRLLPPLLCLCLLLAQGLWLEHQLDHALHPGPSVCLTCVGLAGAHTPLSPTPVLPTRAAGGDSGTPHRQAGRTQPPATPYHSRAPPVLLPAATS